MSEIKLNKSLKPTVTRFTHFAELVKLAVFEKRPLPRKGNGIYYRQKKNIMTTEEFWKKYTDEDFLERFDEILDFFSKELPAGFLEERDAGEVIFEIKDHLVSARKFDRALKFLNLIREKHPGLYHENFHYLDGFLVDYYCFHGDAEKVGAAFANFIEDPLRDYDMFFITFKKLLFYQHFDLLDRAITGNYDDVADSDKLWGYPEYDLAICKLYSELDGFYEIDSSVFPKDQLLKVLKRYRFDLDEKLLSSIEQGVFSDVCTKELLEDIFINDRQMFRFTLQWCFMKYMKGKGVGFALSGRVFEKMLTYWEANIKKKKKRSLELYFDVHPHKFEKHLVDLSGDITYDNKPEMVAVLWGCSYIYDFLSGTGLISSEVYEKFITQSGRLKGLMIGQFTPDLWEYSFVHTWGRPDSVSETEFTEERKIFRKSINFKRAGFNELKKEISAELENIGALSTCIEEGGKGRKAVLDLSEMQDLFTPSGEYDEPGD